MESTLQARIRRLQDTLTIAGDGVIAFGAWALVKTALFLVLIDDEQRRQMLDPSGVIPLPVLYVVVGIILCIDLGVRGYVGLSARSEGRGKKKGPFYLVVAVVAAMVNAASAITAALGMSYTLSLFDRMVSIVVDMTALAALVIVVYCSVRLRRLNKETG